MKTEYWILLGAAGYLLYSKGMIPGLSPGGGLSNTYPYNPSRSTGSGGTTASGGGISGGGGGGSTSNPPISGSPGNSGWVDPSGYYTCPDGTLVNDPSLCPVSESGYVTCADGTMVNDASLCPENTGYVDTGDPCDPNSWAYDPGTCSGMTAGYL